MTGRTVKKWARFYMDGYDLSCYAINTGTPVWTYDEQGEAALCDEVKNYLPGWPTIAFGSFSGFLDNTETSGLHAIANGAGVIRTIMVPYGFRAAPVIGDPVWCGQYEQLDYMQAGDTFVGVTINFAAWANDSDTLLYDQPWGLLIHDHSAETAANSTTGEGVDNGAASAAGGYLIYQVFAGDGTATISIDDSADDSSYSALSGATSGEIDCSSVQYGLVALGKTATVKQYLRWQLSLNTATTVTFALAFVRGR